jgi:hypothetical protein
VNEEPTFKPSEFIGTIMPGALLNLRGKDRDEGVYKLGTLWVWTRTETEHYLVQASHRKHCHRVQGVFWTSVIANIVRKLIEDGMRSLDVGVYTMLRESGIAPLTQYREPPATKKKAKRKR